MRRILAALALVIIGAGLAWSQGAIPGGHEAFLYWWNGTVWTPAQSSQPIPVAPASGSTIIVKPSPGPTTEASSTITAGGGFQTVAAASTTRQSLEFDNLCLKAGACTATTNFCYLFFAASGTPGETTNAIPIPPGWSYIRSVGSIPSDAVQATCDGTGDHFRFAVQ